MLGIISVTFLSISLITKKNYIIFNPMYYFMGVFLASMVFAALISIDIKTGLDNVLHTNWIMLTGPIIASVPLNEDDRERALKVLILSAAIAGVYGIFQFFTGADLIRGRELSMLGSYYRATGAYEFYLSFAGNQLMVFGVAFIFYMDQRKDKTKSILYLLTIMVLGLSIIATYGRSVWIGTGIIIMLGTYLFYRQYFWKIMISLGILAVLIFISLPDIRERFFIIFDTSHNYNSGRINLWHTSWLMIKEYPWFGVGPGLFDEYFNQFKVPGYYDASGHAHNDYLHMMVQGGVISLIAWMSIWVTFFYSSINFIKHAVSVKDRNIVSGIILSISGIMIAALFQCYFVDLENSILWWMLVAASVQVFNQYSD